MKTLEMFKTSIDIFAESPLPILHRLNDFIVFLDIWMDIFYPKLKSKGPQFNSLFSLIIDGASICGLPEIATKYALYYVQSENLPKKLLLNALSSCIQLGDVTLTLNFGEHFTKSWIEIGMLIIKGNYELAIEYLNVLFLDQEKDHLDAEFTLFWMSYSYYRLRDKQSLLTLIRKSPDNLIGRCCVNFEDSLKKAISVFGLLDTFTISQFIRFLELETAMIFDKAFNWKSLYNQTGIKWTTENELTLNLKLDCKSLFETRNFDHAEESINLICDKDESAFWTWILRNNDPSYQFAVELSKELQSVDLPLLITNLSNVLAVCDCDDLYINTLEMILTSVEKFGLFKIASLKHFNRAFDMFQAIRHKRAPVIQIDKCFEGVPIFDCLIQKSGFVRFCSISQIEAHIRGCIIDETERIRAIQLVSDFQMHFCFHLSKSCAYLVKMNQAKIPIDEMETIGALFSLLTVFSSGIPKDFWHSKLNISSSTLIDFTPQLHSMIVSRDQGLVRFATDQLIKLARSDGYSYVKLEICAEWYFACDNELKIDYCLVLKETCEPKEIQAMTLFIEGLSRISVSWAERWCNELQKQYYFISKLFRKLRPNLQRLIQTDFVQLEKNLVLENIFNDFIEPVVHELKRLLSLTEGDAPTTPYGIEFLHVYGERISGVISDLKGPICDIKDLDKKRDSLKCLIEELLSDLNNKKSSSIADMAPSMLNILPGVIPIPGLKGHETIASIGGTVDVLASKNRPKKISLISNNGLKYTYLVKGGDDDLHLDQRIQQFIGLCNKLLSSNLDSPYGYKSYYILPLGVKFGLIQWMENCPSLYHICLLDSESHQNPHRVYEKKMAELGVSLQTTNRSEIPRETFLLALEELEEEFEVKDVIHKEFISVESHSYPRQRQFCETVAISSVIGYILGLGDRHLQNILIDKSTCGVVHIDFGICFEKGRRLKVPEVVPFRLTKVLEDGLAPYCSQKSFVHLCVQSIKGIRSYARWLFDIFQLSFKLYPIAEWIDNKRMSIARISQEARLQLQLLKIQLVIIEDFVSNLISSVEDMAHNRKTSTNSGNIWNIDTILKEIDKESSRDLIAKLHDRLLKELGGLLRICSVLVNCPLLSKLFIDKIDSMLKTISKLTETLQDLHNKEKHLLETYLSGLKNIKTAIATVKKMAFNDDDLVGSAGSESIAQLCDISIKTEGDQEEDDLNGESKNQEIEEFNLSDDCLTFSNRAIGRFEWRLFGLGNQDSEDEIIELICKARDRERLAKMYEGWMPWI